MKSNIPSIVVYYFLAKLFSIYHPSLVEGEWETEAAATADFELNYEGQAGLASNFEKGVGKCERFLCSKRK